MSGIIEIGTIAPAVLVLGAGGDVGRGIVQAVLEADRPVLAVDADAGALDALRLQHPRAPLATLAAAIAKTAGRSASVIFWMMMASFIGCRRNEGPRARDWCPDR